MSASSRVVRRLGPWLVLGVLVVAVVRGFVLRPAAVTVHVVESGDVASEVAGTGTLEARYAATVGPRIQERLAEVLVDEGDPVSAGQLLARLDAVDLERQVAVAEASLASARATVERVRADEVRAGAVLGQAKLNHGRQVELLQGKVAAQADFDRSEEALRVAESDLLRARAATVEAESLTVAAERTLQLRREQLRFTEMRSPFAGLVVRRDRDPGEVVVPGTSILRVVDTNELWISAWVDETAMSGLRTGQVAQVVFRSEAGQAYEGSVARLGREADRETREFVVDVRLGRLPGQWTVGQRADVRIRTGVRTGVVWVPEAALRWKAGKSGVLVEERGRAQWRPVEPGVAGGGRREVRSGLAAGDRVVLGTKDGGGRPVEAGRRIRS